MKNLFDGLLLYEVTLLLLGVILFLILSVGLMYYIIKKEQIKKLLVFFTLPIVMIGYPSIMEISISKDRIALKKYQQEYIENPNDSVARKKVEEITEKLEKRATKPVDIVQISKSNLLLGNNVKAVSLANKALTSESESSGSQVKPEVEAEARDIKNLATVQEELAQPQIRRDILKEDSMIQEVPVSESQQDLKPFLRERMRQIQSTGVN